MSTAFEFEFGGFVIVGWVWVGVTSRCDFVSFSRTGGVLGFFSIVHCLKLVVTVYG